ncbi:hypothetical protein HGM15179_013342 [Zosterops borbonicus]|uniref:Uncharacterized protein n=1 Tax=Zosterops borbonicus TaxID=364589 RepID=A0A8K1G8R9_9PASS|nr:hypothetical protein HGM15179_013342 [Zosterops borbonicus]
MYKPLKIEDLKVYKITEEVRLKVELKNFFYAEHKFKILEIGEISVTDEDAAGPSQPAEETEIEIITRSLSLGELRDLRREFTRQTNKSILTWLLRIWDAAANDTILDGIEARQLGLLSRDVVIDQGIGKTQEPLSLWQ